MHLSVIISSGADKWLQGLCATAAEGAQAVRFVKFEIPANLLITFFRNVHGFKALKLHWILQQSLGLASRTKLKLL